MSYITPERFKQICLETPGVEKYSFLSPSDISKITGRSPGTIYHDKCKRLLVPIRSKATQKKYDGPEVYAYLVRIGLIELPPIETENGQSIKREKR